MRRTGMHASLVGAAVRYMRRMGIRASLVGAAVRQMRRMGISASHSLGERECAQVIHAEAFPQMVVLGKHAAILRVAGELAVRRR